MQFNVDQTKPFIILAVLRRSV